MIRPLYIINEKLKALASSMKLFLQKSIQIFLIYKLLMQGKTYENTILFNIIYYFKNFNQHINI